MTLSFWRLSHLALAFVSCIFLILASVTGIVLAYDAAQENLQPFQADKIQQITLSESIPELKKKYPEIIEISVDHNHFVLLEGMDEEGNDVKAYIDPLSGKILGKPTEKSEFVNWNLALHRSLFLKETGRFVVGIVSFLLLLISISGFVLIIKRQKSVRHFFSKINKDFFSQYFHVVSGRLLLLPIIIISLTGTYLFLLRFELIPRKENTKIQIKKADSEEKKLADFDIFKTTKLKDVQKMEFPFVEDEPEEFFVLKLKDREIEVNQITGQIEKEEKYPLSTIYENLSLDLHTGRSNWIWAIVLGIASLNILFFIWSGFVITFRRSKAKIKNKFKPQDAEIILLVGSENGSTLHFAAHVHQQLLSTGRKSFLTELNQYKEFPSAKNIVIFTSTYGLGDPPSNANDFITLLKKHPQKQEVAFSIVGFGSKSYEDYCAFAEQLQVELEQQPWAKKLLPLHTVNDRSTTEFAEWANAWSSESLIPIASAPALYAPKAPSLSTFKVVGKSEVVEEVTTFKINFKADKKQKFRSGDLLAVYPDNDHKERFYSVGKVDGTVQLIVKVFEGGLGSKYLYQLQEGDEIKARLLKNSEFHFPEKAKQVALIANGTGIAPFLGMIDENAQKTDIQLYCGFRKSSELSSRYAAFLQTQKDKGNLSQFQFAYSREAHSQYVMDLIQTDAEYFGNLLLNGGYIMICGALKMQQDVEILLENICKERGTTLQFHKNNGQISTDCY